MKGCHFFFFWSRTYYTLYIVHSIFCISIFGLILDVKITSFWMIPSHKSSQKPNIGHCFVSHKIQCILITYTGKWCSHCSIEHCSLQWYCLLLSFKRSHSHMYNVHVEHCEHLSCDTYSFWKNLLPFSSSIFVIVFFFLLLVASIKSKAIVVVEYKSEKKRKTKSAERPLYTESNPPSIRNSWNYYYYGASV